MARSLKGTVVVNYKSGQVREFEIDGPTLLRELTGDEDPSTISSAAIDVITDDGRSVELTIDGASPDIKARVYEGVT